MKKLLLAVSAIAFSLALAAAHEPITHKDSAKIVRAVKRVSPFEAMTFPFPVTSRIISGPPIYQSTGSNGTNGTSAAVVNSIASVNQNDTLYILVCTVGISGTLPAVPTATFSSGSGTSQISYRIGVFGFNFYKVTGANTTSLTTTVTTSGYTTSTFVCHCYSTKLAVSYQNSATHDTSTGSANIAFTVTAGKPGFILGTNNRSNALSSISYTGADSATLDHSTSIEGIRFGAASVPLAADTGSQTLTFNWSLSTGAPPGLVAAFY